jgi:hypothetical protein
MNHVFYSPQFASALDFAVQDEAGEWCSLYGRLSIADMQREYPGARIATVEEFEQHQINQACTEPEEITEAEYHDARGCMPPINTAQVLGSASFMLAEMYVASVTTIYAAIQGEGRTRYFKFRDRASLTHRQILARINRVLLGSAQDA